MPAVTAMASMPQKVTRAVARAMGAPPVFRAECTEHREEHHEAPDTCRPLNCRRERRRRQGQAAPAENVAAEVRAAWTGGPS